MKETVVECDVAECGESFSETSIGPVDAVGKSVAELEIRFPPDGTTRIARQYAMPESVIRHACHECIPTAGESIIDKLSVPQEAFVAMSAYDEVDGMYRFETRQEHDLVLHRSELPGEFVTFMEEELYTESW